jgi:hypothetical protein
MPWLHRLMFLLRLAVRRETRERDLDAELQFHLDEEAAQGGGRRPVAGGGPDQSPTRFR